MEKQRISKGIDEHRRVALGTEKISKGDAWQVRAMRREAKEKHRYESHSWQGMEKQRHGTDPISLAVKRTGQARKKTEA